MGDKYNAAMLIKKCALGDARKKTCLKFVESHFSALRHVPSLACCLSVDRYLLAVTKGNITYIHTR